MVIVTSGQSNLAKAALPQNMDDSVAFAVWRQCAPQSNTWFPGPIRVHIANGILIGSAVFAGLTIVTDRLTDRTTDHATPPVTIGRIYVHSTAVRPNNARDNVCLAVIVVEPF